MTLQLMPLAKTQSILGELQSFLRASPMNTAVHVFRSMNQALVARLPEGEVSQVLCEGLDEEVFLPYVGNRHDVTDCAPSSSHRSMQAGSRQGHPLLLLASSANWPADMGALLGKKASRGRDPTRRQQSLRFPSVRPRQGGDRTVVREALTAVLFRGGYMQVFTYNWHAALRDRFAMHVKQLVQWSRSRSLVLQHSLLAKMGLRTPPIAPSTAGVAYAYGGRTEQSTGAADDAAMRPLSLVTTADMELVLEPETASSRQLLRAYARGDRRRDAGTGVIDAFRGERPATPMRGTPVGNDTDPVRRHVRQLYEFAKAGERLAAERALLRTLVKSWEAKTYRRVRDSQLQLRRAEDIREVLRMRDLMRPLHFCATPIQYLPRQPAHDAAPGSPLALSSAPLATCGPATPTPAGAPDAASLQSFGSRVDSSLPAMDRELSRASFASAATPLLPSPSASAMVSVSRARWQAERLEDLRALYVKYAVDQLKFVEAFTEAVPHREKLVPAGDHADKLVPVSEIEVATTFLQYQRQFEEGGGVLLLEVGGGKATPLHAAHSCSAIQSHWRTAQPPTPACTLIHFDLYSHPL